VSGDTVRAGDLSRRILLEQRNETVDTFGQRSNTWTKALDTWASIRPLSGHELLSAQAINAETTHEVVIRYREDVTSAMRVVYQGRYFNVQSVLDADMKHRKLTLLCSEGLNAG
jgi:SPP1 family predicted phage head-tail adaptor